MKTSFPAGAELPRPAAARSRKKRKGSKPLRFWGGRKATDEIVETDNVHRGDVVAMASGVHMAPRRRKLKWKHRAGAPGLAAFIPLRVERPTCGCGAVLVAVRVDGKPVRYDCPLCDKLRVPQVVSSANLDGGVVAHAGAGESKGERAERFSSQKSAPQGDASVPYTWDGIRAPEIAKVRPASVYGERYRHVETREKRPGMGWRAPEGSPAPALRTDSRMF